MHTSIVGCSATHLIIISPSKHNTHYLMHIWCPMALLYMYLRKNKLFVKWPHSVVVMIASKKSRLVGMDAALADTFREMP